MGVEEIGDYYVRTTRDKNTLQRVPNSCKVYVDYGCLVLHDSNHEMIIVYAAGEWIECIHRRQKEAGGYGY